MITRRSRLTAAAAAAVLALTSCNGNKQEVVPTTTTPPAPPPTRTTTTTTTPTAPPVANPLDASDFVADPCTSLTADQQHQYGITSTKRSTLTATEGEACDFVRTGRDNFLVVFDSKIGTGLTYRYSEQAHGSWPYWQPTEVDGYPAVAFGNTDPPSCFFAIGVSDSLHFWVMALTDEKCAESRMVASTILANVKAAN